MLGIVKAAQLHSSFPPLMTAAECENRPIERVHCIHDRAFIIRFSLSSCQSNCLDIISLVNGHTPESKVRSIEPISLENLEEKSH